GSRAAWDNPPRGRPASRPPAKPARPKCSTLLAASIVLPSYELHRDAAERAEVGVQRVALVREHHPRKRARQHEMARLERNAVASELIGEPCYAEPGMTEHAGRNAGLLDLGILVHDAADPAQVDVERADRPAADDDAGRRSIVGDRVENLARVLQARIDDLDRGNDVFGRAQDL